MGVFYSMFLFLNSHTVLVLALFRFYLQVKMADLFFSPPGQVFSPVCSFLELFLYPKMSGKKHYNLGRESNFLKMQLIKCLVNIYPLM